MRKNFTPLTFCILCIILLTGSNVFAQQKRTGNLTTTSDREPVSLPDQVVRIAEIKTQNWQSLLDNELVKVEYRLAECDQRDQGFHNEYVYLRAVNKTAVPLKLEWDTEYYSNGKCIGCQKSAEHHTSLTLGASEQQEGTCGLKRSRLRIFSRMLNLKNKSELSQFALRSILVTPMPAN